MSQNKKRRGSSSGDLQEHKKVRYEDDIPNKFPTFPYYKFWDYEVEVVLQNLGKQLGQGSYGTVFQLLLGQSSVVKVAKPGREVSLLKEMEMLNYLQGVGNVPEVVGISLHPTPLLVMSSCGSNTLKDILKSVSITDEYKILCLLQAARMLDQINESGVIHNDIKANNIIVDMPYGMTEPPEVSIIDFGLACNVDDHLGLTHNHIRQTKSNHMAPELWCGEASTSESDAYSFGIMLLEAIPYFTRKDYVPVLARLSSMVSCKDPSQRLPIHRIISFLKDFQQIIPVLNSDTDKVDDMSLRLQDIQGQGDSQSTSSSYPSSQIIARASSSTSSLTTPPVRYIQSDSLPQYRTYSLTNFGTSSTSRRRSWRY